MRHSLLFATLLTLTLAACGNDPTEQGLPVNVPSVTVTPIGRTVYEGDTLTLKAVYRSTSGAIVPDAPITWSVADTLRAQINAAGFVVALKTGTVKVTATSGDATTSYDLAIVRPSIQKVTVLLQHDTISRGDVAMIGVKIEGPGGRILTGRSTTLSSDNPEIAIIDASGRVRGVSAGTATIRATSESVVGTTPIQIILPDAELELRNLDGIRLPRFIYGDTIEWNGQKEYHESYMETGELKLIGANPVKFQMSIHFAQYRVTMVNGQRQLEFVASHKETDAGQVTHDARGDMIFTSAMNYPVIHSGVPISNGIDMRYRISGTDEYYQLFFRRW